MIGGVSSDVLSVAFSADALRFKRARKARTLYDLFRIAKAIRQTRAPAAHAFG